MKQLFLFEEEKTKTVVSKKAHWKIFIDGASRGNPGPSGTGVYVLKDGEHHASYAFYLGKKTNNQAEYYALLVALYFVLPETKQNKDRHDKIEIIYSQFKNAATQIFHAEQYLPVAKSTPVKGSNDNGKKSEFLWKIWFIVW